MLMWVVINHWWVEEEEEKVVVVMMVIGTLVPTTIMWITMHNI